MNQDVGAFEQFAQHFASLGTLQVGDHAALVGVEVDENAALFGIGLILGEGTPAARQIARGRFDFDYIRADIGEHLRAVSGGNALSAFDDFNRREWRWPLVIHYDISLVPVG